jgi:ribosomal protein S18 acetylase RimI-like enzyme
MKPHPLDNPVWSALTRSHAHLAQGGALAKRYPDDIDPIAALARGGIDAWAELAPLLPPDGILYLAADHLEREPPALPSSLAVLQRAVLVQMVCPEPIDAAPDDASIVALTDADAGEMLALAELTKPGPFRPRTHTLGAFLGVRAQGRLVAMAGTRFRLDPYREVSGVCTHPDFAGQGLARNLVARIVNAIHAQRQVPFLHVDSENERARSLYRHMGFAERAALPMVVVGRAATTGAYSGVA